MDPWPGRRAIVMRVGRRSERRLHEAPGEVRRGPRNPCPRPLSARRGGFFDLVRIVASCLEDVLAYFALLKAQQATPHRSNKPSIRNGTRRED